MGMGKFAGRIGIGLVAGLVGTAAVTLSQLIEMRLRGRPPSPTPAKAVEKVLAIQPRDEAAEQRLATLTHWSYGTLWGICRGLLDALGIHGKLATTLHTVLIQAAAMILLPSLKVAPPVKDWGVTEVGIDAAHHAVYAAAAGLTYERLRRDLEPPQGRLLPFRRESLMPTRRGRLARFIDRIAA